jgi:hypothetical protein
MGRLIWYHSAIVTVISLILSYIYVYVALLIRFLSENTTKSWGTCIVMMRMLKISPYTRRITNYCMSPLDTFWQPCSITKLIVPNVDCITLAEQIFHYNCKRLSCLHVPYITAAFVPNLNCILLCACHFLFRQPAIYESHKCCCRSRENSLLYNLELGPSTFHILLRNEGSHIHTQFHTDGQTTRLCMCFFYL